MEINFTQNFRVTVRAEGHAGAAEGGRSTEGRRRPCKQRIRSLREPLRVHGAILVQLTLHGGPVVLSHK